MTGGVNGPLLKFEELVREQGLKKEWVAQQAGITADGMRKRFLGRRWYPWKPGEKEAIAKALGVPMQKIWGDEDDTAAAG